VEDFWIWFIQLFAVGGALFTLGLPACVCGAVVVTLGVVGVVLYQRVYRPAQQAKQAAQAWPAVMGAVVSSEVSTEASWDSTSNSEAMRIRPAVVYAYEVNGRRYTNNQLRASDSFYSAGMLPGSAQAVVSRYPAGAPVTVYYNPLNPQESVLER
jgi:hypothetical protein